MGAETEIALIARLLETGVATQSQENAVILSRFANALWVQPAGPKDSWKAVPAQRQALEDRLTQLLPTWSTDFPQLKAKGFDPRLSRDIKVLPALRAQWERTTTDTHLWRARLWNRHNWNACQTNDPKKERPCPPDVMLTDDWVLRLRMTGEFRIGFTDGATLSIRDRTINEGECLIAERLILRCTGVLGTPPRVIVSCENLGAYMDIETEEDVLVVYSPGNDRRAVVALLRLLPNVPWVHFGDLDCEGYQIAQRIAEETDRPLRVYIPKFAADLIAKGLTLPRTNGNAWSLEVARCHPTLQSLASKDCVLYQEVFVGDPRLTRDLQRYLETIS